MHEVYYTYNNYNTQYTEHTEREVTNMTPEARAARAKYMREWRKKNPEKQREYNAKKWERKAQMLKEQKQDIREG